MTKIKFTSVLIIFLLVLNLSACTRNPENSGPESKDKFNLIYPGILDIYTNLVDIIGQADIIPYYQKQLKAKEEERDSESAMKDSGPAFKPAPITNAELLLVKTIEEEHRYNIEEIKEKIPEDISFTWQDLSEKINHIHVKWDELKPELLKEDLAATTITGFETALNELTIAVSTCNYFQTLSNSNALAEYIPLFFRELNDRLAASIYYIKYYLRQIILDAAENNYQNINSYLREIQQQQANITSELIAKGADDLADQITLSVATLEEVINLKDLNIIKIKAGLVAKNIKSAQEKLLIK